MDDVVAPKNHFADVFANLSPNVRISKYSCLAILFDQLMKYFSDFEKKFKTSPFAWTNPLSGYMLVVIPDVETKSFQLRLVKDPGSYSGANRDFREEYVMKWMDNRPAKGKLTAETSLG